PRQRNVDASSGAGRSQDRAFLVRRPPRFDRLLQLVGVAADVLLLIGRRAGDQLHPRGDDAVLATEVAIAHRLRVARRLRLRELGFERGDMRRDGSVVWDGQADFAVVLAADLACFASDANAAGLAMASSDRLLRSSVTPAFFS